jgi:hypothetical protein
MFEGKTKKKKGKKKMNKKKKDMNDALLSRERKINRKKQEKIFD